MVVVVICEHTVTMANTTTSDPEKAIAAATSNLKGEAAQQGIMHAAQYNIAYMNMAIFIKRSMLQFRGHSHVIAILILAFSVMSTARTTQLSSRYQVISENKEDTPSDVPHVIYISREKSLKHPHHFKAGAMNVLGKEEAEEYMGVGEDETVQLFYFFVDSEGNP
ncbi:hypothetical protein Tco_1498923 [Tanacetum coccineum]